MDVITKGTQASKNTLVVEKCGLRVKTGLDWDVFGLPFASGISAPNDQETACVGLGHRNMSGPNTSPLAPCIHRSTPMPQ